jgi:hypothetical protein
VEGVVAVLEEEGIGTTEVDDDDDVEVPEEGEEDSSC